MKTGFACVTAALTAAGIIGLSTTASASSHREAPAISNDPAADNTDLWAWHSGDANTGVLHVVASYIPLEEPSGGPNYYHFGDDVLYEIHIARGSTSLDDVMTLQVKFTTPPPTYVAPDGAAAIGGGQEFFWQISGGTSGAAAPRLQTYTVTAVTASGATVLLANGQVPLPSIGPRTQTVALGQGTPTKAVYETYALGFINNLTGLSGIEGAKVWAGQRDDGFYVDLGGAFDLANFHAFVAPTPDPRDNLAGFNSHAIALDIPIGAIPTVDSADAFKNRLGVWASASRRKVRILRNDGSTQGVGPWVQVSRVGLPLVNELVIGLQDKDKYNRTRPKDDLANFGAYILNPIIVRDAEAVGLYGAGPLGAVDTACNGKPCKTGRTDIVTAINIGSDPTASGGFPLAITGDVLRVDFGIAAGFPNGRPLGPAYTGSATKENDVTDIMASVALLGYPGGFDSGTGAPKIQDGVNSNDAAYTDTIPYLPTPWRGWDEGHGVAAP
jgi:hypothetical protein